MEKVMRNTNLLAIIMENLNVSSVLASSEVNRFWREATQKNKIWWPIYHRKFYHIRILDPALAN
jgi:hypothetical protein